jgi:osmotically-inducible protein OsmY
MCTRTRTTLQVKAELAGLKKEDIEISLHDGFLTLSGERKQEEKNEEAGCIARSDGWDDFIAPSACRAASKRTKSPPPTTKAC